MLNLLASKPRVVPHMGLVRLAAVLLCELSFIHFARHQFGFECYRESSLFCGAARNILLIGYGLGAALILLGLYHRIPFVKLLRHTDAHLMPFSVNIAGLAILVLTLPALRWEQTPALVGLLGILWTISVAAVLMGALAMIAPWRAWRYFAKQIGLLGPVIVVAGAVAPFLATSFRPLWDAEYLAGLTFNAVQSLLLLIGTPVEVRPGTRIIGAERFFVDIAPSCSGIEGLVLTTTFAGIYLALFRSDLRFPHALLILPVALLASWCLNAVRIAALVQIGISGYRELAIGAFHSHAGWLMFTVLSLTIVLVTQSIPFFHRTPSALAAGSEPNVSRDAAPSPFFADPVVAQILPFLVFMGSALLASTFAQDPALAYPLRAAAMGVALALFWPYLESLPWRIDRFAVGGGVIIAGLWIFTAAPSDTAPVTEGMAAGVAALWLCTRVLGTSVFVPIIEELFFRGYLLNRIAPDASNTLRLVIAVAVSTVLFAALHDRWIEAAIAGLLFAALALRSRNITDAIVAHGVANGLIALWALSTGNWGMV